MQSIDYGTGNFSDYYTEYRLPTNRAGLTSNITNYFNTSYANIGGVNKPVYVSDHGRLVAGNSFVPTSGGTFSGSVYFSETIMKYGDSGYYTYIDYYRRNNAGTAGETDGYTWASGNTGAWIAWAGYAIGGVETNGTETKSYSTYWATRAYSINSTTGARLNYHYTFRLPAVPDDLTSSSSYYIASSYYISRGGANQPVYLSSGYLQTCNSFVPTTGGTFTGDITIKKTTTIADNYPAQLVFSVVQSDNSLTNTTSWIKVYDDHDTATNGCNMVIQAGGNMILGSGESANNCYTNLLKNSTAENMYITSDGNIYFYSNCGTWANHTTSVYINTSGVLYGACWNDYAEYRKTTYTKPGHVVVEKGDGSLCQSWDRLLPGCEIVSDTYGFAIGETEECKTPIAVSGRVLAYPYEDRESYQPGDAVCSAPGGCVSRMTRQEITMYPERIIGTVSEIPEYDVWGEKDVKVDGRIWIRIR